MPGLFWWLLGLLGIGYIIPLPLMLSIIIGWIAYSLQKSSVCDEEARQRATTIAVICFVVLMLISGWLFYISNPGPIFL